MKTISEHVLDIVQNSGRAKATLIEIIVEEDKINNLYTLIITDNGCGMSPGVLNQAANPFFTSRKTRKVGLGLSLLKQNAEKAGGSFSVESSLGEGTTVKAVFQHSHIDRPPLGDIWNAWYFTVLSHNSIRITYEHRTGAGKFKIDSEEIKEMLGKVSLKQKDIKGAIIELIINNLKETGGMN
jgi:anti-sigma regulatory factor (Ser/Thr protein kinase)